MIFSQIFIKNLNYLNMQINNSSFHSNKIHVKIHMRIDLC